MHGRNSTVEGSASKVTELDGLAYYPIDKFHGNKQKETCKNHRDNVARLKRSTNFETEYKRPKRKPRTLIKASSGPINPSTHQPIIG